MSIVIYQLVIHERQQNGDFPIASMQMRKFPHYFKFQPEAPDIRDAIQHVMQSMTGIYRCPCKYEVFKIEINPSQAEQFVYDYFLTKNAKPQRTETLLESRELFH